MSEDLECPVCMEPYALVGDHQPRVLACSGAHELCAQCVERLPRVSGKIECPQCRDFAATTNPNRGLIAALQLNAATRAREATASAAAAAAEAGEQAAERKAAQAERKLARKTAEHEGKASERKAVKKQRDFDRKAAEQRNKAERQQLKAAAKAAAGRAVARPSTAGGLLTMGVVVLAILASLRFISSSESSADFVSSSRTPRRGRKYSHGKPLSSFASKDAGMLGRGLIGSHAGVTQALCYASAADSDGHLAMLGFFASENGRKSAIFSILRLGLGVTAAMDMHPESFRPEMHNKSYPLWHFASSFVDGEADDSLSSEMRAMSFTSAKVQLNIGVCLALIKRAERDGQSADHSSFDDGEVSEKVRDQFKERLESAQAASQAVDYKGPPRDHSEGPPAIALSEWYEIPHDHGDVRKELADIGGMQDFSTLMPRIVKFLHEFEDLTAVQESFNQFNGRAFLQQRGWDKPPPTDLMAFLSMIDAVDLEESGKLRLMYRHVFEYNAAWLYTGMWYGVFRGPKDVKEKLQGTEAHMKRIAMALYIARIQCSGERMFTTGLLRNAAEEAEYAQVATYKRYQKHASAFVLALGSRCLASF